MPYSSHRSLQQREERFRLLVEAVQDYAIYLMDSEGRIVTWNPGAERNKGYKGEEILGKHYSQFFRPEDVAAGLPEEILEKARLAGHFEGEGWRIRKDGSRFWASVAIDALRDDDDELIGYAKVTRDFTERKKQEETLKASEAALQMERDRLQVTLYAIADGVISTDASGSVTLMNPAAESMTGWRISQARGQPVEEIFRIIDPETNASVPNPLRNCLTHNRAFYLQEGVAIEARDGVRRDIQDSVAPIRSAGGELLGAILVFQDVSRLRAVQREIAFSATHDSLTLLPNRKLFLESLENALARAKTTNTQHIVCYLDLDRFKIINDTAGHAAGDIFLRTVSNLLSRMIRESDLVARIGGDEFAIIFYGCSVDHAQEMLGKILKAIASLPFQWENRVFRVSASIGVASLDADSDAAAIMKHADVACYAAKHAGRNRVSIYRADDGEGRHRHQQLEIAADIRDAIAQNRFSIFAQKIISLRGPDIPRYELLLRMRDHNGSMISPSQFIPAAERYDLMAELDRWVITRVLVHHGKELSAIRNLQLSINLSANSLNDAHFLPFFLDLIRQTTLAPTDLTFEITETALINNLIGASRVIERMRGLGCKIALDDFGIGLSSFSYLRNFEVDYIKIEGSFVKGIINSSVDLSIVRAINSIAHEMRTETVAESVESEQILEKVASMEVDFAQGYAINHPEPIETIF